MQLPTATTTDPHRWALVLAGGDGTRLQELTRLIAGAPIPKQYCRLLGDRSLLEATLERIAPLVPAERTLAIVNRAHLALACPQLTSVPHDNIVVQPGNRDTGPGLAFALLALAERDPDATVAVFPSDHFIADARRFRHAVRRATRLVDLRPGAIALVGIRPDWADPSLGYIEAGAALPDVAGAHRVRRFREKPDADDAQALIATGALWNAFVMVFHVRDALDMLAELRPRELAEMRAFRAGNGGSYDTLTRWNFSSDALTHAVDRLVAVEAAGTGWSDWGTRDAIERTLAWLGQRPPWTIARAAVAA